jgi:hypothetical protein
VAPRRKAISIGYFCRQQLEIIKLEIIYTTCLFIEEMRFDIYGLTADEAPLYASENKSRHQAT